MRIDETFPCSPCFVSICDGVDSNSCILGENKAKKLKTVNTVHNKSVTVYENYNVVLECNYYATKECSRK